MSHLQEVVQTCDKELKAAAAAKAGLLAQQEGYGKELQELLKKK